MENTGISQEDFSEEVQEKGKEYNCEKDIRQIRNNLKRQLFRMRSKEEKLTFIKEEKIKYTMLKEKSSTSSLIGIIICFTIMLIDLLLFGKTESIPIKIIAFVIIGGASGVAGYLISNINDIKAKYTSILMLLDSFEDKLVGNMWQSDSAYEMQKKIEDLQYDIKVLAEQSQINSRSIEKAIDEIHEFVTYRR